MTFLKFTIMQRFLTAALTLIFPQIASATEELYARGHGALEVFSDGGILLSPTWVQVWIVCLLGTFVIGIFFVWKHPLARWVLAGFIISMTAGRVVFDLLGLPFFGGSIAIVHLVCWSPLLALLLLKRPYFDKSEPVSFRMWSAVLTGVIVFSFIFDIRDAVIYVNHINGLV